METPEGRSSIDVWLGSLESEELLTMARQLAELQELPAWRTLTRLLQVKAMQEQARLVSTVLPHADYARIGGILSGLQQPGKLIQRVQGKAREVENALAERVRAAERRREEG